MQNDTTTHASVAKTILRQLGGGQFIAMTGANKFVSAGDDLIFRLPARFAQHGINHVQIKLNELDLYDLTFRKVRGLDAKVIFEVSGMSADQLRTCFTLKTGLELTL